MRRIALLLLVSTTLAFYIPTEEEKIAAWEKLTVVRGINEGVKDGYKLVLVNPIWRHGDRGPTESFPGDVLTEDDWDFGGGGYGELSPIGMTQHFNLGKMLYDRYAANDVFLSSRYKAKEVYVKSTDRNRTLISAMSNFAGMYSRATAVPGTDYPAGLEGWPTNFVPVPIHTENRYTDHIGDPDADCPRQDDLWDLVTQHPEYIAYDNKPRTVQTLDYLRNKTGGTKDDLNFDNIWHLRGGMLCESIHFNDSFADWYPWYTDDVKQRTEEIDDQNIDFQNGIFASGWINGYDLTVQIPTVRGGPLINDVLEKATGVMDCYARNNYNDQTTRCTDGDHFLNNLKYYVISGHDTSIAAYLTVLEAKPFVLTSGGYPSYSAAVITEFFIDSDSKQRYFRVLFHDNENTGFRVITPFVSGCPIGEDFCEIEKLQALAHKYAPAGGIDELCNQRINGPAEPTTTTKVAPPVTESASTTTKKPDDNEITTVTVPVIPSTTSASSILSFSSAAVVVLLSNLIF